MQPNAFRPRLESLEDREVPAAQGFFAVGSGPGSATRVQVYDTLTGTLRGTFTPFEATFTGGVTTAVGDVNNDNISDIIIGAGNNGGPRVQVIDGRAFTTQAGFNTIPANFVIANFFAFEESQRGGAYVSAGDFANAANAEIVVGAGPGGGPRVRILDGGAIALQGRAYTSEREGDTIANFFAFEPTFRDGVTVAASPAQFGSAFSDLVVAPGFGGAPRLRLLSGAAIAVQRTNFTSFTPNDVIADFFVGNVNSRNGLFVAAADYNNDGNSDYAVSPGFDPFGITQTAGTVTIYNGTSVLSQRTNFTGLQVGDQIESFAPFGTQLGAITVGSAVLSSGISSGYLLVGTGGQGNTSQFQAVRYLPTLNNLNTRALVYSLSFDNDLQIPVFVSQ